MDENPYKAPQTKSAEPPKPLTVGAALWRLAFGNLPRWVNIGIVLVFLILIALVGWVSLSLR